MSTPVNLTPIAVVRFSIPNNAWWVDALQFGEQGDTSWSFTGKSFLCDVKANAADTTVLLALTSSGGTPTIIVDDAVNRILHFSVTDHAIRAALPVTNCNATPPALPYHLDLVMVDNGTGERDLLFTGTVEVTQGVTIED
jgi:hypothetical protein